MKQHKTIVAALPVAALVFALVGCGGGSGTGTSGEGFAALRTAATVVTDASPSPDGVTGTVAGRFAVALPGAFLGPRLPPTEGEASEGKTAVDRKTVGDEARSKNCGRSALSFVLAPAPKGDEDATLEASTAMRPKEITFSPQFNGIFSPERTEARSPRHIRR
jgi:hypothetical protein